MALSVIGLHSSLDGVELSCGGRNSSIRSITRPTPTPIPILASPTANQFDQLRIRRDSCRLSCRASSKRSELSGTESKANGQVDKSISLKDDVDFGPATKFKMSDFVVSDRVSIGLGGRGDEAVYEAVVKNPDSPLNNTRVVLRELLSVHAKRRGRRAIEVLGKLVRRRLLYHSYSMQVHGYVSPPPSGNGGSFILVHGYHGSFSLRHWLQQSDWLPTLEATLALDEESVRRVGDDTIGGPAVSRKLRMIRILMRDLLIGVNYLHSHGLAHTELRLENIHISPVDRHIKVGILGNAADFYDEAANSSSNNVSDSSMDRRQMMIAFDLRCVGYMMVKMVLKELMDPVIFTRFKSFLMKGTDPSCLREFLLPILTKNSSTENAGLQILDRYWGAGWNLLALLLTTKPSERISCLDALRHPFLCGPKWRVEPSMDIIRWGLGSTAIRITEEYIYGRNQRSRLAYFIELMEMLNPNSKPRNWLEQLPGRWRLLYSTGRHIGLTFRQPPNRVLIGDVNLSVTRTDNPHPFAFMFTSNVSFNVLNGQSAWPHDKSGTSGSLRNQLSFKLRAGRRLYETETDEEEEETSRTIFLKKTSTTSNNSIAQKLSGRRWRKVIPFDEVPSSLPVAKLVSSSGDVDMTMNLDSPLSGNLNVARRVLNEVRIQVPPEMFDLSNIVCGTYVDPRLLILRNVNGSALLFVRSCED